MTPDDDRSGEHRRTTDELRGLARSVRSGEFVYDGRPKRSLDWASYDEAQAYELADMLSTIRKVVEEAEARLPAEQKKRGRPNTHSPADVAKVLLMQSYFGVSNRVAAGLALVSMEKLRLSTFFTYKTIERGYDPGPVTRILEEVFRITNEYGNAVEKVLHGRDRGTRVQQGQLRIHPFRAEEEGGGTRTGRGGGGQRRGRDLPSSSTKHGFQYAVTTVGVHTKVYAGSRSTDDRSVGELTLSRSAMAEAHGNCPSMEEMLGDSLYASRTMCALVSRYGVRPYFLPKCNATYMSHGVPSWREMTYEFVDDPQGWLREYHMRSISETANSMDKMRFPWRIRKRLPWRKDTESFLRKDVHNVRQYSYLCYLEPDLVKPMR